MNRERRTFLAGVGTTIATIPFVASAAASARSAGDEPAAASKPSSPRPITGKTPGTLLAHEPVATSIKSARAWRVRYVTRDVNDLLHECTGLVIAPADKKSGRPAVTWCHGTTGLGDAACPSAQPDPARELVTYFSPQSTQQIDYGVPGLQALIDAGCVVCTTDYQGLGTPGMHQYEVNRSNARDAVYIVHAARQLDVGVGTRFGCMGWSQGGGAAAAVAELDAADYGDLQLVGTATMSPAVARIAIGGSGGEATALTNPKVAPSAHLVMMFAGIQAANPSKLKLSDVFTPLGVEIIESAWNVQPVHHLNDTVVRLFKLKGPVVQSTLGNFEAWKAAIGAGSAAMRKPVAPVLICVDAFDGGSVIPVVWQKGYADAVKSFGGSVEVREYPNDDHFSLPQSCVMDVIAWLKPKL